MKKTTGIVAAALAGLLVVGGGGAVLATTLGTDDAPVETIAATDPAAATDKPADEAVVEETAPPLVAETADPTVSEADAAFLKYVRAELLPDTGIADATDEQLIAAGHRACEILTAGEIPLEDIRLVEGEQPAISGYYMDTSAILSGAQYSFCPETIFDPEAPVSEDDPV